MRVDLPWPSASLAPNRKAGKHWGATYALQQRAHQDAKVLTRAAAQAQGYQPPPEGDVPIILTFCPPDRRRRDRDNALGACKHALDGAAAALGLDDSRFEPVLLRRGEPVKGGRVVLEVVE